MRFARRERTAYIITDRKRAAAARKQRLEQQALPLFADMVAEQQPSIDVVMTERAARWAEIDQRWRDMRAADWRRTRVQLSSLPGDIRQAMLRYWNGHRWLPGDPSYLADAIHRLRTGALLFINGEIVPARVTIGAAEAELSAPIRKPVAKVWLAQGD